MTAAAAGTLGIPPRRIRWSIRIRFVLRACMKVFWNSILSRAQTLAEVCAHHPARLSEIHSGCVMIGMGFWMGRSASIYIGRSFALAVLGGVLLVFGLCHFLIAVYACRRERAMFALLALLIWTLTVYMLWSFPLVATILSTFAVSQAIAYWHLVNMPEVDRPTKDERPSIMG